MAFAAAGPGENPGVSFRTRTAAQASKLKMVVTVVSHAPVSLYYIPWFGVCQNIVTLFV
jgi:hypothetical protein